MAFSDTSRARLHDQRGFTPLEALIAASIFLFILYAVYFVYDAGRNTFARGEAKTDIQQNARMAISTMERELRMVGTGVPAVPCSGALARIVEARPRKITFRADLRGVFSTLTAAAAAGTSSLSVNTSSGIAAGDIIYLSDGMHCDALTVQTVTGGTLTLTTSLTRLYGIWSRVYRPKDVSFTISAGQLRRDERNPNAAPSASPPVLAEKVVDQDSLQYYDASNTLIASNNPVANPDATVRRIRIALVTSNTPPSMPLQTYALQSDVRSRNL